LVAQVWFAWWIVPWVYGPSHPLVFPSPQLKRRKTFYTRSGNEWGKKRKLVPLFTEGKIDEIKIPDGAVVYELGCGRAGFLRALEEKFPQAKYIGVEYSFWPYLLLAYS
jgi:tRNA G46 methylase TrmB